MLVPKHLRDKLSHDIATLDDITLASSATVRNMGVISGDYFWDIMIFSFNSHIKQISGTVFFHLRNIAKTRNTLSQNDAKKNTFVTSSLDYCNSLLSGCPNKSVKTLQLIQNSASCVLTRTHIKEHMSPILDFSALASFEEHINNITCNGLQQQTH